MTWIIGRAGPFGYAVGLSDIRITLSDETEIDCLQKIYSVGSNMALGFAGSVQIGLKIVEELSYGLSLTESEYQLDSHIVSGHLYIGAQKIFNSFPQTFRKHGCHLILLSAHPRENDGAAPWARCYVHRFYSPDFHSIIAQPAEIVSIGSGREVSAYTNALKNLENDFDVLKMDTMTQHGSVYGLTMSITSAINKTRVEGISNHLHICVVERGGVQIGENNTIVHSYPEENFTMPPVAQNWEELLRILDSKGIAKSAVELARC